MTYQRLSEISAQFLRKCRSQSNPVFYFSADSSLLEMRLVELAHEYYKRGGVYLAVDEIHKYLGWQAEIKTIIDSFTSLKLIVSGSSSLSLDYAKADLSRRQVMLHAQGLSFREYIEKTHQFKFDSYDLKNIITRAEELSRTIVNVFRKNNVDLITTFKNYLMVLRMFLGECSVLPHSGHRQLFSGKCSSNCVTSFS